MMVWPNNVAAKRGGWGTKVVLPESVARRHAQQDFPARSAVLLAVVACCLAGLNLTPVNSSWLGSILAVVAAGVATLDPVSWFFFISASQIVADPAQAPLTLAQLSVLLWFVSLPWNGCLCVLHCLGPYCRLVLPLLVWFYGVFIINRGVFYPPLLYAAAVGAICYLYALRGKDRSHVLLLALLSGLAFGTVGYWGRVLGLPIVSRIYESTIRGVLVERVGAGRGDSNTVALGLPVLIVGVLALSVFSPGWCPQRPRRKALLVFAAGVVTVATPALFATVSRGGLYALPLGLVGIGVLMAIAPRHSMSASRTALVLTVALAALTVTPLGADVWSPVVGSYEKLHLRNLANSGFTDDVSLLAARFGMWRIHLDLILRHPVFGVPRGETVDFGVYGVTVVGSDGVYAAAHNVFLEFASSAGLPALLIFGVLFFGVPYRLYKSREMGFAAPFLAVYVAVLLGFMSLSVGNWKFYWALVAVSLAATRPKIDGRMRGAFSGGFKREVLRTMAERLGTFGR